MLERRLSLPHPCEYLIAKCYYGERSKVSFNYPWFCLQFLFSSAYHDFQLTNPGKMCHRQPYTLRKWRFVYVGHMGAQRRIVKTLREGQARLLPSNLRARFDLLN